VKPATVFIRSCGMTAVLLAGAVNSHAGLSYETDADKARFDAEEVQCKQDIIQAGVDLRNDKLRCNGNQGCQTTAQRTFATKINNVTIRRNNNNGTHYKAQLDQGRAVEGKKMFDARSNAGSGAV
jgi:hypothetical protein